MSPIGEAGRAAHQGSATRGRLRVYLGFAPGAGTTCALLSEGHRRAERGADVVVASVQTHGRPGTAGLLSGLEIIPPAQAASGGMIAEEMDLGAVLARRPQVALVDELAHRNLPETPGPAGTRLTTLAATHGVVVFTHLWFSAAEPLNSRHPAARSSLQAARRRVLAIATRIVPSHGPSFRPGPDTPI